MDRMTITGKNGSPKYQVFEDAIVEVVADKDGWTASCSEYPDCVSRGKPPDEALDVFVQRLKAFKDKEIYGN